MEFNELMQSFAAKYGLADLKVDNGTAVLEIDGMIPQEFAERVVFRPFAPALVSDVYLAWRKNAVLSPAAAAFVETVRNMAADR